jgi:hypothetical protein
MRRDAQVFRESDEGVGVGGGSIGAGQLVAQKENGEPRERERRERREVVIFEVRMKRVRASVGAPRRMPCTPPVGK